MNGDPPVPLLQRLRAGRLKIVLPAGKERPLLKRVAVALAWVIGGTGLVVAVFGVSFYLAMRVEMRRSEVEVPDLTGQTLESAQAAVEETELVLEVVDRRNDPAVPSERVLQQDPQAGALVKRGRKVKLILSLGDRVLKVPDLVGHASRAVEIELRQAGFVSGYEVHVPSTSAVGVVLAQVPPSESPAVPKSRVHRLVSNGPGRTSFVMPDLVGRSRDAVERWAHGAGFRVAVRSVPLDNRAPGLVIGQLPLAGYRVRSNDVIEITVASREG